MRNLYSMKKYWCKLRFLGSDCQDLQRHRPLCRSFSRWLCCTRVQLKISAIVSPFLWNRRWCWLFTQVGEATYSQSSHISSSFLYPNNWRLALAQLKPQDGGLEESRSLQLRWLLDGWPDHLQVRTSVNLLPILPWPWWITCFSSTLVF